MRIVFISAIWLSVSGCASQKVELSKKWETFLPRNMFVRTPGLYKVVETRVRQNGSSTKCEVGKCSVLLKEGSYFVERFGFRTTTVIENEYPIYSATYFVKDRLRVNPDEDSKQKDRKIAIAGDSNTWGEGHNFEDTFVGILARQFPNIDFLNLSRCPFQEACLIPENIELEQSLRPEFLILPIFDSTTAENRKRLVRLSGASKQNTILVDFEKSGFDRTTNGRHIDYPTRLLSKYGHALVADELAKIISSKTE
jgi:hypothetical protein